MEEKFQLKEKKVDEDERQTKEWRDRIQNFSLGWN